MYKDAQKEARSMFPPSAESLDAAKANIICEAWASTRTGEDLWMVFVNANAGKDEVTFAYPINAEPGTSVGDVISHAQMQHEQFSRPPIVGAAEVIHVTQEVINAMRQRGRVQQGKGICDFCSSDTPAVTRYEARGFVMQTGQLSSGGWAACRPCSRLVESRDMEGLAKRMVDTSVLALNGHGNSHAVRCKTFSCTKVNRQMCRCPAFTCQTANRRGARRHD